MLVQFIIVSLLLLNFFLGERGFHLTVTFQRRPVVWSVLTGTLWTVWLYQSCFLLHGQVPALGNGYSCFSYRDSSYIDLALFVGASLVLSVISWAVVWLAVSKQLGCLPPVSRHRKLCLLCVRAQGRLDLPSGVSS